MIETILHVSTYAFPFACTVYVICISNYNQAFPCSEMKIVHSEFLVQKALLELFGFISITYAIIVGCLAIIVFLYVNRIVK